MKLLTIAVPTYNRAQNLALLLNALHVELRELNDRVDVVVSDNASTDGTSEVVRNRLLRWPELVALRNAENVGADLNFCVCLDHTESRYFWVIGDDDMPKAGVIAQVVELLERESPALVYLQSEWVNPVTSPQQGETVGPLRWRAMDRAEFSRSVHVWLTFISGLIVNRDALRHSLEGQTIRRHVGTNLVQLGWIFPVLSKQGSFVVVANRCVLATKGNTGGYGLLTVFGVNFARIAHQHFRDQPKIEDILIGRSITRYLPGLLWELRSASRQRFAAEAPWPAMRAELGSRLLYWLLLVPLGRFPKVLAGPVYLAWRLFHRLARAGDAAMEKLA